MFRYIVLLALVPAILAATKGVSQCSDTDVPMPESINVIGCDETPCRIALNSKALMDVSFYAPHDIDTLTPSVRAHSLGVSLDYALPAEVQDGCSNLQDARCPLSQGEYVIYNFEFAVGIYPVVPVDVDLFLNDHTGTPFACVKVPIQITLV